MIFLELLLKEAGASYHLSSVLARPALIFCFKCLFRGLDMTGWLPVTAELREEGTIVLQFGFISLCFRFDFEGWGLDITVSSVSASKVLITV